MSDRLEELVRQAQDWRGEHTVPLEGLRYRVTRRAARRSRGRAVAIAVLAALAVLAVAVPVGLALRGAPRPAPPAVDPRPTPPRTPAPVLVPASPQPLRYGPTWLPSNWHEESRTVELRGGELVRASRTWRSERQELELTVEPAGDPGAVTGTNADVAGAPARLDWPPAPAAAGRLEWRIDGHRIVLSARAGGKPSADSARRIAASVRADPATLTPAFTTAWLPAGLTTITYTIGDPGLAVPQPYRAWQAVLTATDPGDPRRAVRVAAVAGATVPDGETTVRDARPATYVLTADGQAVYQREAVGPVVWSIAGPAPEVLPRADLERISGGIVESTFLDIDWIGT